jgi:hypothetical protein
MPGIPEQIFGNIVLPAERGSSPNNRTEITVNAPLSNRTLVAGQVRLQDGSSCGIRNEFFATGEISATVELLSNATVVAGPTSVNAYGDYLLVAPSASVAQPRVRVKCETAEVTTPVSSLPLTGKALVPTIRIANRRPVIASSSATFNGTEQKRPDLPQTVMTKAVPEIDNGPGDDAFLTFKGLDTRKIACEYYRAIGAVEGCDASGNLLGRRITFEDWKRQHELAPYNNGAPEEVTFFINKADLNLARDMHGRRVGPDHLAYYVCNYPGPLAQANGIPVLIGDETQSDIDRSIEQAVQGNGLVACVAMDYSVSPGVNGDQPFTKFYTFGPSGGLLLSVSLDGRREKFMPGACVACHGGEFYTGRNPEAGAGRADLKSHFLPFDIKNFYFASRTVTDASGQIRDFRKDQMQAPIKKLNQLLWEEGGGKRTPPSFNPNSSVLTEQAYGLIENWYRQANPFDLATQNEDYVPSAYAGSRDLYQRVMVPMCRSCHIAQSIHFENNTSFLTNLTCGSSARLPLNHVMPNALVPFERFWSDPALPALLQPGCQLTAHPGS